MCALSLCEETKKTLNDEIKLQERSLITYTPASFLQDLFPKFKRMILLRCSVQVVLLRKPMVHMWNLAVEWCKKER